MFVAYASSGPTWQPCVQLAAGGWEWRGHMEEWVSLQAEAQHFWRLVGRRCRFLFWRFLLSTRWRGRKGALVFCDVFSDVTLHIYMPSQSVNWILHRLAWPVNERELPLQYKSWVVPLHVIKQDMGQSQNLIIEITSSPSVDPKCMIWFKSYEPLLAHILTQLNHTKRSVVWAHLLAQGSEVRFII